ncbi:hypothetical protein, partial [Neisseria sicca]|uniref:hypothetical protein n=1 Tax=Neisseria sicca TaxID=490 RepID=UPI001C98F486
MKGKKGKWERRGRRVKGDFIFERSCCVKMRGLGWRKCVMRDIVNKMVTTKGVEVGREKGCVCLD